jgi:membrane associated rhomboid family serine protease
VGVCVDGWSIKKHTDKLPWGNLIVMVLMTVTFAIQFTCDSQQRYLGGLVLGQWTFPSLFGYMWLHVGPLHIFFNLLVLSVFGRQVCIKIGNATFISAFVFLGLAAAIVHMLYDGRPAIGASGAIMGVLGMSLVLCFNRLSPAGPWIILAWFILTVVLGAAGMRETAYLAHAGGFLVGIVLANILIFFEAVDCTDIPLPLLLLLQRQTRAPAV